MLRMRNVSKTYRTDALDTQALREVSLEVPRGDFVAVMGPPGSGKTSFMNVAGLLDTFDSGIYHLDGVDVRGLCEPERILLRNETFGFMFQDFNLIPDLNIYDNVDVPLRYRRMPGSQRAEHIDVALEFVGLTSCARYLPTKLSHGQRQRAAVARAIAGCPALLLADEPMGNLNSTIAAELMDLLERVNKMGTTIVMVTHDPLLALRARRTVQIADGELLSLGSDCMAVPHSS